MCILPNYDPNCSGNFACAQAGCQDCLNACLKQHEGLVYLIARRQCPGHAEYADLIQEGRIGLWQAILHFEPEQGYAFSTYASVAIRNRIWNAVELSLKPVGWLEPGPAAERLTESVTAWQREQVCQAIAEELVCLPERLRQVIQRYYGISGEEPLTLAAIGQQMGLTRERIRQLRNEALVLLRLPALSMRVRGLCARDRRSDYQQARRANAAWLRGRRGKK